MRDILENPGQELALPEQQEGCPQGDWALCQPGGPAQGHLPTRVVQSRVPEYSSLYHLLWPLLTKEILTKWGRWVGLLMGLGNSRRAGQRVGLTVSSAKAEVRDWEGCV